ncbi:radical SAM family heme chaperone HemW [uncultured Bacteroides sp.]|uniref:radical SAM family heme chaperone HemW n=1 Tax=uncultured Bacteroides sp. TaxID=162156 RepID=UPI0025FC42FA|nr:radical SAM family heme chaperone HemW [uncultured Bacteroides sp.]
MAGIYLHIPFCKTRCIYCDFYSTTRSELKGRYVQALCRELTLRRDYLKGEKVETIYFGGGTPSQLDKEDFTLIFNTIGEQYGLEHSREITLEANPDDLTTDYLKMLSTLPFNRISMGIQTFDDATLKLLNRRHNAQTAIEAVRRCREAGFRNISIDLIYGLPGETRERWEKDLRQAIDLNVEHISAYHLIYEEDTPIYNMLKQQRIHEVDEDTSLHFFTVLMDYLQKAGYEHYEISNFCRPGKQSRHNTSYWKGIPYLGCGPSAHSFNGTTREWNISSIDTYIKGIEENQRAFETELLDATTRYNEFIITTMRTAWGTPIEKLKQQFGNEMWEYCRQMAAPYLANGKLEEHDGALRLTREGIFISDSVMSDLLWVD